MTSKKLTIEDILKKKELLTEKNVYFSSYFNAEIDIEKIPADKVLDVMKKENEDEITKYKELIYNSCPFFRQKELHETLNIKDPVNAVSACYDDNICEVIELGNIILSRYGFTADKVEQVKK